jgi:dTDP-4-dehydrorhamnose 3,5-epimerase
MEIERTSIPGVLLVKPEIFKDTRGFFIESFHVRRYAEAGIDLPFVQDNRSRSRKGTLRGLHYQNPYPQGKLVYVTRGAVFDVIVDVRVGSPTFGKWYGAVLDDETHHQIYAPPGCAHGFCVLSDYADFEYKCTDYYHPEGDRSIRWNDADIGISWPIDKPVLSDRDACAPLLRDVERKQLLPFA